MDSRRQGKRSVGIQWGGGDYVNCGNKLSLDITDAITIEAWGKWNAFNSVSPNYDVIAAKETGGVYQYYIGTRTASTGVLGFGDANSEVALPSVLQTGVWYHIVGVSKLNTFHKYYVNGIEQWSSTPGTSVITSGNLKIGYAESAGFGTNFFNGTIDEVRIYDAALEASQIKTRYVEGLDKLHSKGKLNGVEYYQRLTETRF